MDDVETGNAPEVSDVTGGDGIAKLQGAGSDNEVTERNIDRFRGLLAANLRDDFRRHVGHRMDWDLRLKLVQETSPLLAGFRILRPIDAMAQFRQGQSADYDGQVSNRRPDHLNHFWCFELRTFGTD